MNKQPHLLLMGNPNVGKSVIFSKLTGMEVLTANYSGTTVSYTKGTISYKKNKADLTDVPGVYSLASESPAEQVAIGFLEEKPDGIIFVLDATNLTRSLYFAFQVMQKQLPMVFALNLSDVAERKGIRINSELLEEKLGARVITTIATRNHGMRELLNAAWEIDQHAVPAFDTNQMDDDQIWEAAESIAAEVQVTENVQVSWLDRLGDSTMKIFPGIPIAILVLLLSAGVVVGGGKGLRALIFLPLVNDLYAPWITGVVNRFFDPGMLRNIMVGDYGFLIKGIEWPIALILPYVFLFYIVLSFLEDSGYLPRIGVLVDGLLRRIGIQGSNIVSFMMGYGCAVPAILGSRAASSYKERLIIAAVVSLAVPCVAQTGAFIALLGDHSMLVLISVYLVSFLGIITAGLVLDKVLPGKTDPMLIEIPNLLLPDGKALLKKIWIRTKHFLIEAEIPMIMAVGLAAILVETGLLNAISVYVSPLVVTWLGLPVEATIGLILGIIRRELAVLPLLELDLSTLQMFIGAVVSLFYLPCLSVFAVLVKEFKVKVAAVISVATIVTAFVVGGVLNHTLRFIISIF